MEQMIVLPWICIDTEWRREIYDHAPTCAARVFKDAGNVVIICWDDIMSTNPNTKRVNLLASNMDDAKEAADKVLVEMGWKLLDDRIGILL